MADFDVLTYLTHILNEVNSELIIILLLLIGAMFVWIAFKKLR